jgi:hypothetical protein
MSRNLIVSILLGLAASSQAHAACPCPAADVLRPGELTTLLNGNTVCAIFGSERWQEWHSGSAILELGNNPAGENVGSWTTSDNGSNTKVVYNYGTGGTFSYSVCQQGSNYDFCGAKNVTNASVKPGKGGC